MNLLASDLVLILMLYRQFSKQSYKMYVILLLISGTLHSVCSFAECK
jgi:hypothetical protein